MKITKTGDLVTRLKEEERKANAGCSVCPCCGESKSDWDYITEGISGKGVMLYAERTWAKGLIFIKHMKCNYYSCLTCGAEWESDPYQWA